LKTGKAASTEKSNFSKAELGEYLGVTFQQVVHSMKTGEADCVEAIQHFGDIEWTFTRMPDSLPFCERSWLTKFFSVDWL
jgi:hypothetical protein